MIYFEDLNYENVAEVSEIERLCIETPWGIDALKKDIENENAFYVCIKKDDKIIGYGGIWISIGTADITNIAVLPLFRRKGFGKDIVERLLEIADRNNVYDVNLEVNENNTSAIFLYKKCGFHSVGIRKKYYNNRDNAIIMKYTNQK